MGNLEPWDKLQIGYKSIMRTDESVSDSVSGFDLRRVDVQGVEFKSAHFLIFLINSIK